MQHLIPFSITELMHDFFFFYSPEMCCHKNVCDLRLKKWKCRGDLWNVSLFRGVFYYLHRACLHIQHSLSPLLMPGTAHSTHTLLNPVYLSWTKCDTSGTSLSYPPSWWKVHWLQISFSYTVTCRQETHQWQTSQDRPSSATTYITVPMTTRLVAAYQRQVCQSDRWQLRQTVTVGLGWGK